MEGKEKKLDKKKNNSVIIDKEVFELIMIDSVVAIAKCILVPDKMHYSEN